MLDIKYIRDNAEQIKEAAQNKGIDVDIDRLLQLDEEKRNLQGQLDELRSQRKKTAQSGQGEKPSEEQIQKGKELKQKIQELEEEYKNIEQERESLMVKVPVIPSKDTPIGKDDSENVEVKRHGEPTEFNFKPKDHIQLGRDLDLLDLDRGVKVAGYRGYYLKNEAVILQMGLMMHALSKLMAKGFVPIIPPTLVKSFPLFGSGFFSGREYDSNVDEIYKIANDEVLSDGSVKKEDKFLIGTAEPSLLAYYADEVLEEKDLPVKFCGFSPCYRSEIGSYGKDTKGIYRIHEFMKVEQVILAPADIEVAEKYHQEIMEVSTELHQDLGLPYRWLQICTGDMGTQKYKMFDIEAWMPSRGGYGETGSASNCTDWQARRLNVKYQNEQKEKKYVYMLNNTAIASPRILISILENYQKKDGSIEIPEILRKYFPGNQEVISPQK